MREGKNIAQWASHLHSHQDGVARRNVAAARLADPEAADQDDALKRLSPQGAP